MTTNMMRAVQLHQFGGPEVLQVTDTPRPEPGPAEVLIRVAAAGVNFGDLRARAGEYSRPPPLPLIPGFEATGVIEKLGPGAEGVAYDPSLLKPGSPIVAGHAIGAYAEYALVPADSVFALPDGKSLEEAAAIPVNFFVAWAALRLKGALRAGETVLIHAGAGGVGSAAIQLARLMGARVIATASSEAKLQVAREAGAQVLINYATSDFVAETRRQMGAAQPVHLVLDSVGGETLVKSLDLLQPWGRLVSFGQASGVPSTLNVYTAAIPRNLDLRFLARGWLASSRHPRDRAILFEGMQQVMSWWGSGAIRPIRVQKLPLADARHAHELLANRSTIGKLLLIP